MKVASINRSPNNNNNHHNNNDDDNNRLVDEGRLDQSIT